MHVEVDAFSGRPNPHWNLSHQETQEFLELFQNLPQSGAEESVKQDLGYRGLVLTAMKEETGGYEKLVVSNGIVLASGVNKSQQFTDQGRSLERWLLQKGKGHMPDDLYAYVLSQIEDG